MFIQLRKLFLLSFICICFGLNAQTKNLERPKLVVGLVVDQMRWDYLYKYYDRYGGDGFKRMLNEGFIAENTFITYIPTYIAVGYCTFYSGILPAFCGFATFIFLYQKTYKRIL